MVIERIIGTLKVCESVWLDRIMSGALLIVLLLGSCSPPALAHEVVPAIADMTLIDGRLNFEVRLNLEPLIAGIDLAAVSDTNSAPQAGTYDTLRALDPAGLEMRFRAFWPQMAARIFVRANGKNLPVELTGLTVQAVGDVLSVRPSAIRFRTALPPMTTTVDVGWAPEFGTLVIRQQGVDAPFDGYLERGAMTGPIQLKGGDQATGQETFFGYIPIGFGHIVPKGLDHILFVLGLFFLSTRLGPLLWQVSAFTVAHTITLALASLGYVSIPGNIVEPLIAASIVFVAVENIFSNGISRWRIFVVFGFGLLHGLGFASVLAEFGLPDHAFLPALIGFNVGVELGQLTVIAAAFFLSTYWFGKALWYRRVIATRASAMIALVGAWWFIERVFL